MNKFDMNKFDKLKESILNSKTEFRLWQKIVTFLSCVAIFITTYSLILPAITMSYDDEELVAYCGEIEHVHNDDCYNLEITCPLDHIHNDDCYIYIYKELVCLNSYHEHDVSCYSNPLADINEDTWILKTPGTLTANWKEDLFEIATSQVGYEESSKNYRVLDDGTFNGYTIYGNHFDDPYGEWNLLFIKWCFEMAGIPNSLPFNFDELDAADKAKALVYIPEITELNEWIDKLKNKELYVSVDDTNEYSPNISDIVFLDFDNDLISDAVGIVTGFNNENSELFSFDVVIGDNDGKVNVNTYSINNNDVVGYMTLPDNPCDSYIEDVATDNAEPMNNNLIDENDVENNFDYVAFLVEDDPDISYIFKNYKFMLFSLDDPENIEPAPLDMSDYILVNAGGFGVKWHEKHDGSEINSVWKDLPADESKVPADAHFRFNAIYTGIDPQDLSDHGYKLIFNPGDQIRSIIASGKIQVDGQTRGEIKKIQNEEGQDVIEISFDEEWVKSLINDTTNNKKTIKGDFYFQGYLNLSNIDKNDGNFSLGGISIQLPIGNNLSAEFGEMDIIKTRLTEDGKDIIEYNGGHYLKYLITVVNGSDPMTNVVIRDSFINNSASYLGEKPYLGVSGTPFEVTSNVPNEKPSAPYQSSTLADANTSTVYLTSTSSVPDKNCETNFEQDENGNILVWNIGELKSLETRTLTYYVKLNEEYLGIPHIQVQAITNKAEAFSYGYPHNGDEDSYLPDVKASLNKSLVKEPVLIEAESGRYYEFEYKVSINAPTTNDYDLTNVVFRDSYTERNSQANRYKDKIWYVPGSVGIYSDESCNTTVENITVPQNFASSDESFSFNIGDLKPGQKYWIKYKMQINAAEATLISNGAVGIFNNAKILSDATKPNRPNNGLISSDYEDYKIFDQTWESKSSPGQIRENVKINVGTDKVYDARNNDLNVSVLPTYTGNKQYEIPAGAYKYVVEINKGTSGDWDVSATQWRDSFSNIDTNNKEAYIKLSGFMQVEVFNSTNNLVETKWVYVNGNTGFSFKASQIEAEPIEGYWYRLTYYGEAQKIGHSYGFAIVNNDFTLSGNVGSGSGTYYLPGFTNRVTSSIKEPGVEKPRKFAWYYDPTDTSFEKDSDYRNTGALYWYIKAGGSKVPEGTRFQESSRYKIPANNYIRAEDSDLGFYTINLKEVARIKAAEQGLSEEDTESYVNSINNLEDLYPIYALFERDFERGYFEEVPKEVYTTTFSGNFDDDPNKHYYDINHNFLVDYSINSGEELFWIIRTEPRDLPQDSGKTTYTNKVNYYTKDNGWSDGNNDEKLRDSQVIAGPKGSMAKTNSGLFKVSDKGTNFYAWNANTKSYEEYNSTNTNSVLQSKYICVDENLKQINGSGTSDYKYKDGIYIVWKLDLNKSGAIDNKTDRGGNYTVTDILPEGVELAYVRGSYINSGHVSDARFPYYNVDGNQANRARDFTGRSPVLDNDPTWTLHRTQSNMIGTNSSANTDWVTNYYTATIDGEEHIKIFIPKIWGGGDNNVISLEVVCRITDPDIYMQDVMFTNTATFANGAGIVLDSDSSNVKAFNGNLNKTDLTKLQNSTNNMMSLTIPYTIVVNDTRNDMDPNDNVVSVPLIDHMSSNLSINMNTLKIYADFNSLEDRGKLIYDGGSSKEMITDEVSNQLYYATDVLGNRLYWQTKPFDASVGDMDYRITYEKTSFPIISDTSITNENITGSKIKDGLDLYYNLSNKEISKDLGYVEINSLEDLVAGEYKIQVGNHNFNNSIHGYLTDVFNSDRNGLLGNAEVEDAITWTLIKADSGNYYIRSENGNYLHYTASNTINLSDEPITEFRFSLKTVNGKNTFLVNAVGTSSYLNKYAGKDTRICFYNGTDEGSAMKFYLRKFDSTSPTGTEPERIYWKELGDIGTTVTNYPVISTARVFSKGVIFEEMVKEVGDNIVGNIPDAYEFKDAADNKLYYQLDDEGNIVEEFGVKKTTTAETSKQYKTSQIKIAVEDYRNQYGETDGSKVLKFYNLPDNLKIGITYNVTSKINTSSSISYNNETYWDGYDKSENGETGSENMEYAAGGSAMVTTHGAVKITKYDGSDTSVKLPGAGFALFRAQYELSTQGYLYQHQTDKTLKEINVSEHNHPAVYRIISKNPDGTEEVEEMKVVRQAGTGELLGIRTAEDEASGNPNKFTAIGELRDYKLEHQLKYDDSGKLLLDANYKEDGTIDLSIENIQKMYQEGKVLAYKETGADGTVTYGLNDQNSEDAIHFNKVYGIVEYKAPTGYDIDPSPHFFVVPEIAESGRGLNYFYHEDESDFPSDVHIVRFSEGGVLTYYLDVFDYKANVTVSKDFSGNSSVTNNFKTGTYSFGIWDSEDVTVTSNGTITYVDKSKMLSKVSIKYTEDDFGWYLLSGNTWSEFKEEKGKWYYKQYSYPTNSVIKDWTLYGNNKPDNVEYGIYPGRIKTATFNDLNYNKDYYVFELDDNSNYILDSGLCNGNLFKVTYISNDAEKIPGTENTYSVSGNKVHPYVYGGVTHTPSITIVNNSFEIGLNKSFADIGGNKLQQGIRGNYLFGLWAQENGTYNLDAEPLKVVSIEWKLGDYKPEKTVYFTDIEPGTYAIYEIDPNTMKPVEHEDYLVINGNKYQVEYLNSLNINIGINLKTPEIVEVTNKTTASLPMTGGNAKALTIGTLLFVTVSSFVSITRLKSRKKEE